MRMVYSHTTNYRELFNDVFLNNDELKRINTNLFLAIFEESAKPIYELKRIDF